MDTLERFRYIPTRCFIDYGKAPIVYVCTTNTLDGLVGASLIKRAFKNKVTVEVFKYSTIQPSVYGRIHEFSRTYLLGMTYNDEKCHKEELEDSKPVTFNKSKTESVTIKVKKYLNKLSPKFVEDSTDIVSETNNYVFHNYNNSHLIPKVLDQLRDILGAKLFYERLISDLSIELSDSEKSLLVLYKRRLDDYVYEHINNLSYVELKLDDERKISILVGISEYYHDDIAEAKFYDNRYGSLFDIIILFDVLHMKTYLYNMSKSNCNDWTYDDIALIKSKLIDVSDSDKQDFIEQMLNKSDLEVKFILG